MALFAHVKSTLFTERCITRDDRFAKPNPGISYIINPQHQEGSLQVVLEAEPTAAALPLAQK